MKEECGIFGVYNEVSGKCIKDIEHGLQLLQHRGQDSFGISWNGLQKIETYHKLGLVTGIPKTDLHSYINCGIGHVRYCTSGDASDVKQIQPIHSTNKMGNYSIAHNGNLPKELQIQDTRYIVETINQSEKTSWREILIELLEKIPGVYCLLLLTNEGIYAIRDGYGVRPLVIGKDGNDYCVASETNALHRFNFYDNVNPGEIWHIYHKECRKLYQKPNTCNSICSFEYLYFLKPNSCVDNRSVQLVRQTLGKTLAKRDKSMTHSSFNSNKTYYVIGIPDSGVISAKAYAEEMEFAYESWIKKRADVNRSFIQCNDEQRKIICNKKFIYDHENLKGKNVVIVDDTIVRGNVMKKIIELLKQCEVNEIHIRIPSPPIRNTCLFGIDIPTKTELIAYNKSVREIEKILDVNSLEYLKTNDLNWIISETSCKRCFGGNFPSKLLEW